MNAHDALDVTGVEPGLQSLAEFGVDAELPAAIDEELRAAIGHDQPENSALDHAVEVAGPGFQGRQAQPLRLVLGAGGAKRRENEQRASGAGEPAAPKKTGHGSLRKSAAPRLAQRRLFQAECNRSDLAGIGERALVGVGGGRSGVHADVERLVGRDAERRGGVDARSRDQCVIGVELRLAALPRPPPS